MSMLMEAGHEENPWDGLIKSEETEVDFHKGPYVSSYVSVKNKKLGGMRL